MKKTLAAAVVMLILIVAAPIYVWYQRDRPPDSITELEEELSDVAFAYAVVDDTPLILMSSSAGIVLDTLDFDFPIMKWPPGPAWEYSGTWFVVTGSSSTVSADLTSQFGPRVVFGIIRNPDVSTVEVRREGLTILVIEPGDRGFIHQAEDVQYGDDVVFLDDEGNVIRTLKLEQQATK